MEGGRQMPPSVLSAVRSTLAEAAAPQGGDGHVSEHASWGTSSP